MTIRIIALAITYGKFSCMLSHSESYVPLGALYKVAVVRLGKVIKDHATLSLRSFG
jgi:hypothetical protein